MTDLIPQDKDIIPSNKFFIGEREIVLETMCAYKVSTILALVTRVSDELQLPTLLMPMMGLSRSGSDEEAVKLAASLLPKLFTVAPEALVRATATAIVSNAELEKLFKQPGAIAARVEDDMAWLWMHATADQICDLASACLDLAE